MYHTEDMKQNNRLNAAEYEKASEFLKGAIEFEARILESGMTIREQSKQAYGHLLDIRMSLMAVANELFAAKSGIPGKTNPSISERLLLVNVFFQGVYPIETMISEGQYIKASAALKQDYELLARLGEIAAKSHKYGKTPNVKYAPTGTQWLYGELNDVAHIAKSDLLQTLVAQRIEGVVVGISPVPHFVPDVARNLYELHVYLLREMCRELFALNVDLYGSYDGLQQAILWFSAATKKLEEKEGWKPQR